ncbi:MAG TPA: SpoIIE family protein phosphatase [Anaerolineales bacterium]|nr:SpoIIE family protein phosphatase [Anaerolineales bacterium]
MPDTDHSFNDILTIKEIVETLNRAVDMRGALEQALTRLLELMQLETGWIFLKDPNADDLWDGRGYILATHANLPPALALDNPHAWNKGCECQGLCDTHRLQAAYNEVRCSRLVSSKGERYGLDIHASVPLRAGDEVLGILNVAASDWDEFNPQNLALLTNLGTHIGEALRRTHSFDLLRDRRLNEHKALLKFSSQLLGRHNLDDLISYLMEEMPTLLDTKACALLLKDHTNQKLSVLAAYGWKQNIVAQGWDIPVDQPGVLYDVIFKKEPVSLSGISEIRIHPEFDQLMQEEGLHHVVLVPMESRNEVIGILMINSTNRWEGAGAELQFLRLLSNQAAMALENARLHQIELANQRMDVELEFGRRIQMNMLPKDLPEIDGWSFSALYQPARQVGGDFYDWFVLPGRPNQVGVVIADVVDKGIAAAMFMTLSRTMIRIAALTGRPPAQVLRQANEWIIRDGRAALFLTVFYAIIDTQTGEVVFSNAGHNPPLLLQAEERRISRLTTEGRLMGYLANIKLEQKKTRLDPGDCLVLYTDGVTEAVNARGAGFGVDRLSEVILSSRGKRANELQANIVTTLQEYTEGLALADDITLICLSRLE